MMKPTDIHWGKSHCLQDDDFYAYLTRSPGQPVPDPIQTHLVNCDRCREELAELVKMLHPEGQDAVDLEPSEKEIEDTLALIQQTEQAGRKAQTSGTPWYRWGAIAAAAALTVGLGSMGAFFLYERARSQGYCDEARVSLEQVYAPRSPSDLRLDLPFTPVPSQRAAPSVDGLGKAEQSFNKALGVRENSREALLGLGYIELSRAQFAKAEEAFNGVLGPRDSDAQALLGRGVSRFEAGVTVSDPITRDSKLRGALNDFEGVLKLSPGPTKPSTTRSGSSTSWAATRTRSTKSMRTSLATAIQYGP